MRHGQQVGALRWGTGAFGIIYLTWASKGKVGHGVSCEGLQFDVAMRNIIKSAGGGWGERKKAQDH